MVISLQNIKSKARRDLAIERKQQNVGGDSCLCRVDSVNERIREMMMSMNISNEFDGDAEYRGESTVGDSEDSFATSGTYLIIVMLSQ